MCRYQQVNRRHIACHHVVVLPDELIVCYTTNCKFSPNHPQNCNPITCSQTCWQNRLSPEQYTLHVDGACPACTNQWCLYAKQ